MNEELYELVKGIVDRLAKTSKKKTVQWSDHEQRFIVQVDSLNQGRMIGKGGATIGAINVVLWYAGYKITGEPTCIYLLEPEQPRGEKVPIPFVPRKKLDEKRTTEFIEMIMNAVVGKKNYKIEISEITKVFTIIVKRGLKESLSDPDLSSAVTILVKAAIMAEGSHTHIDLVFE